jgi:hypothetical protein
MVRLHQLTAHRIIATDQPIPHVAQKMTGTGLASLERRTEHERVKVASSTIAAGADNSECIP